MPPDVHVARDRLPNARIVAMIIARMGSTRVLGKSLVEIAGRPMLDHIIELALQLKLADSVAVVTSSLPMDDAIAAVARARGVNVVRGHPDFVLDRVHQAAEELSADVIVYVGGDCPLLDPTVIDRAIIDFFRRGCDYLSNYEPPTFPEGMDVNIVTREAVKTAFRRALAPSQRIHAFSYLTHHPDEFAVANFANDIDLSRHHWSLDFPEDLVFIRAVYERLHGSGTVIRIGDVLALIAGDPAIAAMDRALQRNRVSHAFWNSSGIVRDMNADIIALANMAAKAMEASNHEQSHRCFEEIARIANALARSSL
jgi:spore coat polysaccharide biosynthesis protein SpsF